MAQGNRTLADTYSRTGESRCRFRVVQDDALPDPECSDSSSHESRDDACHGVAHARNPTTTDRRNSPATTAGPTMKFFE
jgi:hypothetical protein